MDECLKIFWIHLQFFFDKQYFYNINTSNESIYTAYNYKYNGSKNSYDTNLTWIVGSTNADFTIKEKSIKDKTITYGYKAVPVDEYEQLEAPQVIIKEAQEQVEEVKRLGKVMLQKRTQ